MASERRRVPAFSKRQDEAQENHLLSNIIPEALRPIPELVQGRRPSRTESPPADMQFSERVFDVGKEELLYQIYNDSTERYKCVIHFATLQRMNLHVLQKEIVDEVAGILKDRRMSVARSRVVRGLMKEYCKHVFSLQPPFRRFGLKFWERGHKKE
jgi:hypothetical protein